MKLKQSLNCNSFKIEDNLLKACPLNLIVKYRVIPIALCDGVISLVAVEGFDEELKEVLEFILGKKIVIDCVDNDFVEKVIDRYSEKFQNCKKEDIPFIQEPADYSSEKEVLKVINEAIRLGASDIHWEAQSNRNELLIRYRIDGDLLNYATMPYPKVVSYIKLRSHMNIDQKRLPQDGRLPWIYEGKKYDLRVSSLSTIHGENIVMRILDREDLNLDIDALGLPEKDRAELKGLFEMPDGLVLVTGPTGSGKTTTLYAGLNFRSQFDHKIMTVEDPVEYEFSNFCQIPVSTSIGMGFADALRAVLRQSPDTIMIGEIRDPETAQIAINAALTGHLVLATLHTNDALSAVSRLLDLGVEPYQISAALRAVVAQRLVRRLCSFCKQSYLPDQEDLRLLNSLFLEPVSLPVESVFFHAIGCEHCQYSGFKGRLGLFEILSLEQGMSGLIYDKASHENLKNHVHSLGMTTLQQCGLKKVLSGLITLEEVAAVTIS